MRYAAGASPRLPPIRLAAAVLAKVDEFLFQYCEKQVLISEKQESSREAFHATLSQETAQHQAVNMQVLGGVGATALSHQLEYSLRVHCNGGDEGVALSSLPNLPQDSLMLDVRPGIILGAFDSGDDDTAVHETTTDCYAPSRLRSLGRKQRPRVSLDGNHRETPHFVSVKHANEGYDVYLAQVELTFRFQKIDASTASTTIEELALVRWMDDAPTQEDLGELHTESDKPDQRMPLEEVLRQIDRKVRHTYTPANRERDQSAHD